MLFTTVEFVGFFIVAYFAFLAFRGRTRGRKLVLLACSYWFYTAWNPPFVLILVFSTLLDFVAGKRMGTAKSQAERSRWLLVSCAGNLGVLAFFKYADFIASNMWFMMPQTAEYPTFLQSIVLPLGISFYTFQSMSYTIDVFRKDREYEKDLTDFALYISFFPQLIAGPILRSTHFLPQLKVDTYPTGEDVLAGLDQLVRGFAKKILIADTLGVYVYTVDIAPNQFGAFNHLIALYAFSFQVYFDFSGYSDIAIGAARMMGFRIPENFRLPFLSRDPSEIWSRWHISLTSWLRDYLYISLGGNRRGKVRTYWNLFITMSLCGFWHGAGWGYVLWGVGSGLWLVIHRFMSTELKWPRVPAFVGIFFTFHIWSLICVFFRTGSFERAMISFRQLFDFSEPIYSIEPLVYVFLPLSFLSHFLGASKGLKRVWEDTFLGIKAVWYAFVGIAIYLTVYESVEFIYFQF